MVRKKEVLLVILLFIFLLFISSSYAQDWMYNSKDLTMKVDISSELEIVPLSQNYFLKQVNVNLTLFPKESVTQNILSITTIPDSVKTKDSLFFVWENPLSNKLDFLVNSKVNVKNDIVKIKNKVLFPIKTLPKEIEIYTRPTKNIDSDNEEIIKLASEIAQGEDDLYVVTNKLAEWVERNINYSLTTLTASVSQPASWVLENKYGVCDELTSLFVAMARSLGIPARYISGVAYTDFQDLNDWGPHAWAEVYFPSYGWVPFDITYREFGFVDPTHTVLKYSLDSDESSTRYEWIGKDVTIKTKKLDIKTDLENQGTKISPPISLNVNTAKNNIGFGSYNLIEVSVENLEEHYITTSLLMAEVRELEGEDIAHVLLKPKQKKNIYFVIKLTENLMEDYIYTIPIEVYTINNISAKTEFKSTADDRIYSKDEIEKILSQEKEEEEKTYSKEVLLECQTDKEKYYPKENALITCYIKNIGNTILENLNVCLKEQCQKIDLGISQEKSVDFEKELSESDINFEINAKNSQVSKTIYLPINVIDQPVIKIENIKKPEEVSYKDIFAITFTLKKESRSIPRNVVIKLKRIGPPRIWVIEELAKDEGFIIKMKGSDLGFGENEIDIVVDYEDDKGKKYETKDKFNINLKEPTFSQKTAIFFKEFFRKILGIFG